MPRSVNSAARPMTTSRPPTVPRAPSPGSAVKRSACGSGPVSAVAAEVIAAATACSDACSTAPAWRSRSARPVPARGVHAGQRHPAGGDGSGLVQHHGAGRLGGLQRLVALDEDPELGPAPARGHQRGRGREAERARARDDQDREPGTERVPGGLPASSHPARVSTENVRTSGTNTPQMRSASRWMAAFSAWACSTSRDQVSKLGVGPDLDGPDDQAPGQHDRPADDAVPLGGLGGDGLPRHHAAVHRGLAEQHLTVGGDGLARAHDEHVPRAQPARRDLALGAIGLQQADVLRPGGGQLTHGRSGDSPGAGLIQPPGQQERGDRRGDLQVDAATGAVDELPQHALAGRAAVQDEHRVDGPAAGGDDAERDEGVHRGGAVPGVDQRRPVEGPRGPQRHRRRAGDQGPLPAGEPVGRDQRQQQGKVRQRNEEDKGEDQPAAQVRGVPAGCRIVARRRRRPRPYGPGRSTRRPQSPS